jgi:hypothetical protein
MLHSWPLIIFSVIPPLALAFNSQGRQALQITYGSSNAFGDDFVCLVVLFIALYARLLMEQTALLSRSLSVRRYAIYTAPQLLGILAAFVLPLMVRYGTGLKLVFSSDIQFWGPAFVLLIFDAEEAFLLGLRRTSLFFRFRHLIWRGEIEAWTQEALKLNQYFWSMNKNWLLQAFLMVIYWYICFAFPYFLRLHGDTLTLIRLFFLLIAVPIGNWIFLSSSFSSELALNRYRIRLFVWFGAVLAFFIIWFASRVGSDVAKRAPGLGATQILFLAQAAWLGVGLIIECALSLFSRLRCSKANPFLTHLVRILLISVILWRLSSGSFNESPVRTVGKSHLNPPINLQAYLHKWIDQRRGEATEKHPYPAFIIVSEGGGIRATYWTSTLLASLQDTDYQFSDHVLALSGVSGGSVGVSIFAAMAHEVHTKAAIPGCRIKGGFEECARFISRSDLLSPPLASMLLAEPMERLTRLLGQQDRAVALERSLERAWEKAMGDDLFGQPLELAVGSEIALLLNATVATNGIRLVISSFDGSDIFSNSRVLDGRGLLLSTAALLSARFPVISPVARYDQEIGGTIKIVDGGYSDNSGAATGADMLRAFVSELDHAQVRDKFRPVVIVISYLEPSNKVEEQIPSWRTQLLGAFLGPVLTLDAVRQATSDRYLSDLHELAKTTDSPFLQIQLRHTTAELPLGWTLSGAAADAIDAYVHEVKIDPASNYQRVGALLTEQK